ncbi:PTS mannitol transporter subunit IICB [Salipaludibacillus agaradhaerens]|uniref:PTS mannitol transporter subunit IICB n=1 Tax=Salipaludibacillus agaradhaerens TaxID=76935 RepID=UPI002150DED7|nr:PTS mannitol transporter subunit IICB [Salipaludibacillus agaradhaerens]MCR6104942.1 PTS mannitol transporter subunit IICB [Salipaludibacillus agaradhaerens]MCR6116989.1 PTS mannitol transporter subunit IICB [Salipaludibacillus agaradhaerens]UJW56184.1 PTS mannitol transporter subunit IICB [Bacillus sp. A116_S68]
MAQEKGSIRTRVQKFGNFLSSMIMPNIGAFIAWGLITALFIPDGWFPNESFAEMVGPMITYLLPLLIGFTGGKLVHGTRGGVVGATATMGVIVGAEIPMFIGAMIMGPLGGFVIKQLDKAIEGKIKPGFEMLINNFSAGIFGGALAILGLVGVGPLVNAFSQAAGVGVEIIVDAGLLPLASILIEPAKVLFLNNAINHGVLTPLGLEQASDVGRSILFLLETNPGPGLGILLAYMFVGKGMAKRSAPGAAIIHFFGGIHEIYFPYILMKPTLIIAAIAGGMGGVFTFNLLGAGLPASPSPGSIIAYTILIQPGNYIAVYAGVIVATVISFAVAAVILKASKNKGEEDLSEATSKMESMKGKKSSVSSTLTEGDHDEVSADTVNKIIFACDAGMGSSAMGASILRDKVKKAGLNIEVANTAISQLPDDADVVITHKDLTPRAKQKLSSAHHISVDNFLSSPEYDKLIDQLK